MMMRATLLAVLFAVGVHADVLPSVVADRDGPDASDSEAWVARYLNPDIYRLTPQPGLVLDEAWSPSGLRSLMAGDHVAWLPVRIDRPASGFEFLPSWGDKRRDANYTLLPGSSDGFGLQLHSGVRLVQEDLRMPATERADWSLGTLLSKGFGPLALSVAANRNARPGSNVLRESSSLRDTWSSEFYGGYGFSGGSMVGLDYSWAQSSIPGADSSRVLSLSSSFVMTRREKLAFTLSHGFGNNDSNADLYVTYSRSFP